jgi:hypothetical protein
MSTIIRIARGLAWAAVALSVWAAILFAMPFVGPSGRQVAVIGDTRNALHAIAASGGRAVEVRRGAVLAISSDPHFPSRLYRNGAALLIEGRIGAGCFSRK